MTMFQTLRATLSALALVISGIVAAQDHDVRLALDWVPNTNHTGIYVALANGWYDEAGVSLEILPYGNVAPNILVTSGRADVGISGNQGVLAAAALGEPVVSIAAIIASNTAALAVLQSSGIESPSDLDGKLYAAFGGPVERPLIEAIINHDGGQGDFRSAVLGVSGFDALLSGRADFIWIYEGWDGVRASLEGIDLRLFNFVHYGIPDHYNPVFTADPKAPDDRLAAIRAFLVATRRGYEFAAENPAAAAELLLETAPRGSFVDAELVRASQEYVSDVYLAPGEPWGVQELSMWKEFGTFLLEAGVFTDVDGEPVSDLDFEALFSNEWLPQGNR